MEDNSQYWRHFVLSRHYFARVVNGEGTEKIVIEERANALDEFEIYAIVKGEPIRARFFEEFAASLPGMRRLEIPHRIELVWDGEIRKADFIEVFKRSAEGDGHAMIEFSVVLKVGDNSYATEACDTLQDAIWELEETISHRATWRIRSCYHCFYSGHARFYATSDREYWCYRDIPDFPEWKSDWKGATPSERSSGHFYVNAFHTCAAWRAYDDPTST